ncbi:MAG: acyl carrier protein [Rhizobiaceae bacterium]|nr:acyl carrier protein [Rhizobiaceae bacterium]
MKLFEIVGGVLNIDPNTLSNESSGLNTQNWDSLRHIELMLAVETAFGVRFSMSEMVSMQNLGDMRNLLVDKGVDIDRAAA